MQSWFRSLPLVASLVAAALLGAGAGTATTQVTLTPLDQAPACQPQAALKAPVFWRTQWRADQKDVPEREAAAAQGINRFFADGGCFASAVVARAGAGVTACAGSRLTSDDDFQAQPLAGPLADRCCSRPCRPCNRPARETARRARWGRKRR